MCRSVYRQLYMWVTTQVLMNAADFHCVKTMELRHSHSRTLGVGELRCVIFGTNERKISAAAAPPRARGILASLMDSQKVARTNMQSRRFGRERACCA